MLIYELSYWIIELYFRKQIEQIVNIYKNEY